LELENERFLTFGSGLSKCENGENKN